MHSAFAATYIPIGKAFPMGVWPHMPKSIYLNLGDDINMGYRESTKYYALSDEYHIDYEIHFIISGKVEISINENRFIADSNTVIIINTLAPHHYTILEYPYRRYVLMFKENYLRILENDSVLISIFKYKTNPCNQLIKLAPEQGQIVRDIFCSLYEEYQAGSPYWDKSMKALLLQLVVYLFRISEKSFPLSSLNQTISKTVVYDVQNYINNHFTEPVNLKDTAVMFHTSMHYLCHLFKETTGTTFTQYLLDRRISYAREILSNTNKSIQEISMETGFASMNHFIKTFKKKSGISPSHYREKFRRDSVKHL
jgi:AraC-like DNA-binding protein